MDKSDGALNDLYHQFPVGLKRPHVIITTGAQRYTGMTLEQYRAITVSRIHYRGITNPVSCKFQSFN